MKRILLLAVLVVANAVPALAGGDNPELDFRKAIIANIAFKNACRQFVGEAAVDAAINEARSDFLLLGMPTSDVDASISGIKTEVAKAEQIQMKGLCTHLTENLDRNLEDKRATYLQGR